MGITRILENRDFVQEKHDSEQCGVSISCFGRIKEAADSLIPASYLVGFGSIRFFMCVTAFAPFSPLPHFLSPLVRSIDLPFFYMWYRPAIASYDDLHDYAAHRGGQSLTERGEILSRSPSTRLMCTTMLSTITTPSGCSSRST